MLASPLICWLNMPSIASVSLAPEGVVACLLFPKVPLMKKKTRVIIRFFTIPLHPN